MWAAEMQLSFRLPAPPQAHGFWGLCEFWGLGLWGLGFRVLGLYEFGGLGLVSGLGFWGLYEFGVLGLCEFGV